MVCLYLFIYQWCHQISVLTKKQFEDMRWFSFRFCGLRCDWWSHLRQKLMKRKDRLPLTLTPAFVLCSSIQASVDQHMITSFSSPLCSRTFDHPPSPYCSVPILTTIWDHITEQMQSSSSSYVPSKLELEFPLYVKPWICAKASHLINSMALKCITALNVLKMIHLMRSRVRRCFLRRSLLSTHYLFNSTI